MFLREKYDAIGTFEKMKARLADGSTQDKDEFKDDEISSPTASLESIFNMLKMVAVEKRHLLILDVGGAYLNAKINRAEYMYIQPELVNILVNICPSYKRFKDSYGKMLVQIDKAMYGLVQSAKLWYDTITGVLSSEMTYLGMNIKITEKGIEVSMVNFIQKILKEFDGLYHYAHPADDKLFVIDDDAQEASDKKGFHRVVAKLLYLCKRDRPDIALPVHYLCTRVKNPSTDDEGKLKRILGYLQSTMKDVRKISSKPFSRVEAFIDAAHAVHVNGFGQSGGIVMVGDSLIEAITRKQKCAARDSTEAELVALETIH